MPWFYLLLAGLFEIGWAIGLKHSAGFSRLLPSLATVASMIVSFLFLSFALRSLPLGTAYAIWTGIGTVGTVIAGLLLYGEPMNATRLACVALIVLGIVGLKMTAT